MCCIFSNRWVLVFCTGCTQVPAACPCSLSTISSFMLSANPAQLHGSITDLAWNPGGDKLPHRGSPPACWEQGVPRRLHPPASSTSPSAQTANTWSWKKSGPSFRSWTLDSGSFCSFHPSSGCIFSWHWDTVSSAFCQQQQTEWPAEESGSSAGIPWCPPWWWRGLAARMGAQCETGAKVKGEGEGKGSRVWMSFCFALHTVLSLQDFVSSLQLHRRHQVQPGWVCGAHCRAVRLIQKCGLCFTNEGSWIRGFSLNPKVKTEVLVLVLGVRQMRCKQCPVPPVLGLCWVCHLGAEGFKRKKSMLQCM